MATPFAFALPKGTPDKDISTIPQWRVATGPYRITSYMPHQSITIRRNPTFKSVDTGHARRPPGRHRRADRRHARAVGERDRRRPAGLVLRVGAARSPDRAEGAVPRAGVPVRAQQHHVLLHERAQVPVQQAGGAPGGQLRDRPQRAGQDLRRPGHAHREHHPARASAPPTRSTHLYPLQPGQGQAVDPAGRRGGRGRDRVGPQHRSDAHRRAVPGRRAQLRSASRRP